MKITLFKTAHRWATTRVAPTVLRFPFTVLLIAAAMAGCEKSDNNDPDTPGAPGITFTAVPENYPPYEDVKLETRFDATAQQLVVDWGDGSAPETYTDLTGEYRYGNWYDDNQITHTYADRGTYTVHIKEEGLMNFRFYRGYNGGQCLSLTVHDCPALQRLECSGASLLNVSGCPALQRLECFGASLLNMSGCPALQRLDCYNNQLTSLDVSKCPALQVLNCYWGNQLTALDVSGCPALQELSCSDNQLTSLDVSKCPALQELWCSNNQLTSLDVSKCPALQELWCYNNQLTALNVSGCSALQSLGCSNNQLTALNASGCTALQTLMCYDNQLTALDVSQCPALTYLNCWNNQLTATALNTVFTALPNCSGEEDWRSIDIRNNPGAATCNRAIAENKGWGVIN